MDKKTQKKRSKNFSKKFDYYGETPVKVRVDNTPEVRTIITSWGYTATPNLEEIYKAASLRNWIALIIMSVIAGALLGILLTKLF